MAPASQGGRMTGNLELILSAPAATPDGSAREPDALRARHVRLVCFWRGGGEFFGMADQRLKLWIVLK